MDHPFVAQANNILQMVKSGASAEQVAEVLTTRHQASLETVAEDLLRTSNRLEDAGNRTEAVTYRSLAATVRQYKNPNFKNL